MDAAFAAMQEAESYHFLIDALLTVKQEGASLELPFAFEGDFQAPDRLRGEMSLSMGFFSIETEVVLIGDTYYSKSLETGEWVEDSQFADTLPLDVLTFASPTGLAQMDLEPRLVGIEELAGGPAYRIRANLAGDLYGGDKPADADFWIDVDDKRFRKMLTQVELPPDAGAEGSLLGGELAVSVEVELTDFGLPVDIQAPTLR